MKSHEFLIEYKRDVTQRQYGDKLIERLRQSDKNLFDDWYIGMSGKNYSIEEIHDTMQKNLLASFENYDPTPNNQYTPWMVREYVKGEIRRLEDLSRISEALKLFHKYKNTAEFDDFFGKSNKDIMTVSAGILEQMAETLDYELEIDRPIENEKGQAETVYNDDKIRVVVPQDEAAACYYGRGTRWCTAATKGENYFAHYNKEGPLYIILPKNPSYKGEKYQLHIESKQFMNEKDNPVSLTKLLDYPKFAEYLAGDNEIQGLQNLIIFQDENVLENISNSLVNLLIDFESDRLAALEANSTSYHAYVEREAKKKGYITDDGDIDWDKVREDDTMSYSDYNPSAFNTYWNLTIDVSDWSKKDIIDIMRKDDENSWLEMNQFPELYERADVIDNNGWLAKKMRRNVGVILNWSVDSFIDRAAKQYNAAYKKIGTFGNYTIILDTKK